MRWELSRSTSSRLPKWSLNSSFAAPICFQISSTSSGLDAVTSRGAAAPREVLYSATPKAASISGRLPSFTAACAFPTRLKLNMPMRLAATVRATATPKAAKSWVEMRKRSASSRRAVSFVSNPARDWAEMRKRSASRRFSMSIVVNVPRGLVEVKWPVRQLTISRKVSMGWYLPSAPITVRNTVSEP